MRLLAIISLLLFCSCSGAAFVPKDNPNPWADDYKDISGIEHYQKWGPYNVHDPAFIKVNDYYYMFSTDAIFASRKGDAEKHGIETGNIQVRKSKDLVNWEFVGWAFDSIPQEAIDWVVDNNGWGATNIWAPYVIASDNGYRLYYSVSAFGKSTSYIGLAESESIEGPWELKGCVVKTNDSSPMNAIDPSVIIDGKNDKMWMHYGSYFGGLYCVRLNPDTGLAMEQGDLGHLIARRANYKKDNLEAPEIIYNSELDEYYLFTSYDPLMTTYNVRAARAKTPEGPFFDFFDHNIKDTLNNFPVLTAPYRFDNHPGWAGVAHCGVVEDGNGNFFMAHQGRLSPDNGQMVLHVRQVFFNKDGWPVVSPERYAGTQPIKFRNKDIAGKWEIVYIIEPEFDRSLEAGQVLWGEGSLFKQEWNNSVTVAFEPNGDINDKGKWIFDAESQTITLDMKDNKIDDLIIFAGQDWENQKETILFTGLDTEGRSVWGKRIE